MKNEVKHTAHSSYRCEYHLVFAPKYRRKVIYKAVRRDIIEIIKKAVQGDESGDHRGRGMPRSHSSASEYPAVHEYSTVRGDAQEQKCTDDLRQARESEVQIREPEFLVPRILCGYGRKECEDDPGVYPKPVGRRFGKRPNLTQGVYGPVYG